MVSFNTLTVPTTTADGTRYLYDMVNESTMHTDDLQLAPSREPNARVTNLFIRDLKLCKSRCFSYEIRRYVHLRIVTPGMHEEIKHEGPSCNYTRAAQK